MIDSAVIFALEELTKEPGLTKEMLRERVYEKFEGMGRAQANQAAFNALRMAAIIRNIARPVAG